MPIPSGSLSLIFRRDASCGKMFLSLCSFCALSSAWGGIDLRQSRQALELEMIGLTFFSDSQHFLVDEHVMMFIKKISLLVVATTCFRIICWASTRRKLTAESSMCCTHYGTQRALTEPNLRLASSLVVHYVLCCALFFVHCADSSALVVDSLASNGQRSRHWLRHVFWARAIACLGSSFLSSGGNETFEAVRFVSIVCSLPLAVLMYY
jgi:BCCT, betaine/carnitine/choline family transporter